MEVAVFQFSLFGINTYVVWDTATDKCVIIDPGMINSKETEAIIRFIEAKNLELVAVINTHLHIDHAIGNDAISAHWNVPIMAHKDDFPLGDRIVEQAQMFGLPERPKSIEITKEIKEGDKIKIGTGELEVIHVPGHSPGHIALYDKKDGFIIGGDILFQGSIGRTDLPGGNHTQLLDNIRKKLFTLPDETIIYPGHGPSTTIGHEKTTNPFF